MPKLFDIFVHLHLTFQNQQSYTVIINEGRALFSAQEFTRVIDKVTENKESFPYISTIW